MIADGGPAKSNPFAPPMKRKNDDELRQVLDAPEGEWLPEAKAAAIAELDARGLSHTRPTAEPTSPNVETARTPESQEWWRTFLLAAVFPVIGLFLGLRAAGVARRNGKVTRAHGLRNASWAGLACGVLVALVMRGSCHR